MVAGQMNGQGAMLLAGLGVLSLVGLVVAFLARMQMWHFPYPVSFWYTVNS